MKSDGGPAFPGVQGVPGYGPSAPVTLPNGTIDWANYSPGMTLRDYFAARIAASACSAQGLWPAERDAGEIARRSYVIADALITEREKA